MSTAVPQPLAPALKPGNLSSEFSLANIAAFAGIALVAAGVALAVFHPMPDLQPLLVKGGLALIAGSVSVYGGFRTFLKYAHVAKGYEAQANMVAAFLPGQAGVDAKLVLGKLEQIIDALPDDPGGAPAPSPVAAAAAAGAAAAAKPAGVL